MTGVGALYIPGTTVLVRAGHDHQPASAASQRQVPAPRHNHHPCEALLDETSTRVQAIHPSGLPLACGSRIEQELLGLSPELRTPPLRATHVGTGTGHRARTQNTLYGISRTSNLAGLLDTCDLVSHS
jgi:hypothetical protein